MKKVYTKEERIEARRLSVKKYNDKTKEKHKKLYQDNKKEYSERNKKYYIINKSQIKDKSTKYHNSNKKSIRIKKKTYYEENKDMFKKKSVVYRNKTKDKKSEYDKKYRKLNKEKINLSKRKYKKGKRLNDPLYKLKQNIRRSISDALRKNGFTKKSRSYIILGCSFEGFLIYIESKFKPWMTWKNYGLYNGTINYGWDLDHIIPICKAKTEEELIKLNHYLNFQPLCSHINRNIKRDK